jgi:hypothetical protein
MDSTPLTLLSCAHRGDQLVKDTSPSSILSLLQYNNEPPIPSDISSICNVISEAEANLSNIDHQISHAAAVLNDLLNIWIKGKQHLKMVKLVLHPI